MLVSFPATTKHSLTSSQACSSIYFVDVSITGMNCETSLTNEQNWYQWCRRRNPMHSRLRNWRESTESSALLVGWKSSCSTLSFLYGYWHTGLTQFSAKSSLVTTVSVSRLVSVLIISIIVEQIEVTNVIGCVHTHLLHLRNVTACVAKTDPESHVVMQKIRRYWHCSRW